MEVSCQVFGSFYYMSWLPDGRFVIPCPSLQASTPIWASEVSLARTCERGGEAPARRGFAPRSHVLARLASLAQIGELARRLSLSTRVL